MSENLNLPPLTPDERRLEQALGALAPVPPGIDRDAVLFDAGRAAGAARTRRHLWTWRAGCAASVLVCAGLLALRPVKAVERIVLVHETTPPTVASATAQPAPPRYPPGLSANGPATSPRGPHPRPIELPLVAARSPRPRPERSPRRLVRNRCRRRPSVECGRPGRAPSLATPRGWHPRRSVMKSVFTHRKKGWGVQVSPHVPQRRCSWQPRRRTLR